MNIDANIIRGLIFLTLMMVTFDMRKNTKFLNLRENFRMHNFGRFQADDFVEKKQ